MATRGDIKRPGGITKVDLFHSGPQHINHNLRNALLGEHGFSGNSILEIREFACNMNHSSLTTHNSKKEPQILFRILGKNTATQVRLNGLVNIDGLHLGERPNADIGISTHNNGVRYIPEAEFHMFVPPAQSIQDFVWRVQRKISRISNVLWDSGWTNNLVTADGNLYGGQNPAGVDEENYGDPIVIPYNTEEAALLKFNFLSGGYVAFECESFFWDSFVIWCSPLFCKMTGFPELIGYANDLQGEANFVTVAGTFNLAENAANIVAISKYSLFSTFEQRRDILITSSIPTPIERYIKDGDAQHRFVLGFFDIRGAHEHTHIRNVKYNSLTNKWEMKGNNVCGRILCDTPNQTGFVSAVLPSNIVALNIRCILRRNRWDFENDEYIEEEVPLLQTETDWVILRMVFTPQL